jgi:hypothetical protein
MGDEVDVPADPEDPASEEQRAWGRDNQRGNMFLLHSASFYLSGRRLLTANRGTSLMPGLVCGAYGLEQVIKASLEYKGIRPPVGNKGHDLFHLTTILSTARAETNATELVLFSAYFNSRYFDKLKGR